MEAVYTAISGDLVTWGYLAKYHRFIQNHYSDNIMSMMVPQITIVSIVYSTVCSGADQSKHQSSASLAFVSGIHWWPVNSPRKGPVTWKMFPFYDIIMCIYFIFLSQWDSLLKSTYKKENGLFLLYSQNIVNQLSNILFLQHTIVQVTYLVSFVKLLTWINFNHSMDKY